MGRTQIYLGSDELELLDRVARVTGASRSELCGALSGAPSDSPRRPTSSRRSPRAPGPWRGRAFTGSEYVDSVRGDLSERLGRLGLE